MQLKSFSLALGAAAVSVLFAGNAAAQTNVTIYGIADSGPEFINNAGTAGNTGSIARISSGNLSGSRIGFRGTEDMGGGLKTVFDLENGFDIDTGTPLQGGTRLFSRQAWVGIEGGFGGLYLGRQNSLMLDWMSKYNTMDNATWSSKVHDAAFSDRLDNAIKYSIDMRSVNVTGYYSTGFDSTKGGEVAGTPTAGREYGIGTQYTGGALRMAAVYDQKNGQTAVLAGNTDRHLTLGARFKFGDTEVMGGALYRRQITAGTPNINTTMYWLGATYQVTAPFQISGSVYHTNLMGSDKDPTSFITLLKYSLSKRTDLYLINSYVMNKGNSLLGVNGFGSDIAPGRNQFGTMAGVRHFF